MVMETQKRTTELNDEAGEEEQSLEAQVVHTNIVHELRIQAEVAAHGAVRCPYGSLCERCVAANAKQDARARIPSTDEKSGLPIVSMYYELSR